jgi:membrane peptidoglycan carboxypeptidase
MGVTQDNDLGQGKPLDQYASFTLGTNQITPVAMADAYATIAAQGVYCAPTVITGVTDASGKHYKGQRTTCKSVLDGNTANELTSMLEGVLTQPGATAAGLGLGGRPAAGKTGTTDSSVATWFDGYTPQLAAAVWTGFVDSGGGKGESMSDMSVGGQYYGGEIFGATISAPIWQQAMDGALAGKPVRQFTAPTGFPTDLPGTPTPGATDSPNALDSPVGPGGGDDTGDIGGIGGLGDIGGGIGDIGGTNREAPGPDPAASATAPAGASPPDPGLPYGGEPIASVPTGSWRRGMPPGLMPRGSDVRAGDPASRLR